MKNFFRVLALGLLAAVPVWGQDPYQIQLMKAVTTGGQWGFGPRYSTATGPTCNTSNLAASFWDTTTGTAKVCNGTSYLTLTTVGTTQDVIVGNGETLTPIQAPGAPTVTPSCSGTCVTTYGYKIVALLSDGTSHSAASAEGTTAANAATLDATHFNTVSWSAVTGATSYDVYRTTGGAAPPKRIFNASTAISVVDNGIAGSAVTPPTTNTTGQVTVGNATSASNATCVIKSIISGGSATDNFLNCTGTTPTVLSAVANAVNLQITGAGSSSFMSTALNIDHLAGYTGSSDVFGLAVTEANATTGTAVGLSSTVSAGTKRVAGYFGLAPIAVGHATAALVVNNGTVAGDILVLEDSGGQIFKVADQGVITFSTQAAINVGGDGQGFSWAAANGQIMQRNNKTPDMVAFETGTAANSFPIYEAADSAFDFNNGRCGTSACGDPALIVHSRDQVTTEYAQISVENATGAAGFQSNLAELRVGGSKTAITEAGAQAIIRVGIPTSTNVYGMTVFYSIYDINGANYVTRTGSVKVQGGNSGGTATCTINTTQDAEGEDGSQIATSNAATLTYTWTNVVSTTNCDLSLNAASSEGTNTVAITWTAILNGNSSAITITPQ